MYKRQEYKWNHGGEKITIRGNLWFNQYEPDSGGGDAIAFAREFYGLDFPEAVKFLLEQQGVVILPQKDVPAKMCIRDRHSPMAKWAFTQFDVPDDGMLVDIGCGGGFNIRR